MPTHRDRSFRRLRHLSYTSKPALTVLHVRRYLSRYPEDSLAWLILGEKLGDLARYREAEFAFSKSIEFCPEDELLFRYSLLGHMFRYRGDLDQAADWYRRVIEVAPDDATGHIFLGAALARQGKFAEAEATHRFATRCQKGCIDEAWLNLGFVLRAQERFSEAIDCFAEALRLGSDYEVARQAMRDCERFLGMVGGQKPPTP